MVLSSKHKNFLKDTFGSPDDFDNIENKNTLPADGQSEKFVLDVLKSRLKNDLTYGSGKILGAMTTPANPFAKYVYAQYLEKNLGDAGLCPETREIEQEVIKIIGSLLHNPNAAGNMLSGGTEGNYVSMLLAKKLSPQIKQPEIIVPESAHCSFDKGAELMGITIRKAKLLPDFRLDLNEFSSFINENTIGLVGIAGTTSLGLVDPLVEIGKLAEKHHIFFHVDGAFGGFVLPFMEMLGYQVPLYDFRINSVLSYTIDPHKMGMGVIPGGSLVVRDVTMTENGYSIPYLAGGAVKSLTILGTRPGAGAISFWALLQHMGKSGYKQIVKQCMENTYYMMDALKSVPHIKLATEPTMNVLGLQVDATSPLSVVQLDQKLRAKGWALGLFRLWNLLRVVLMPHIHQEHIDAFISDLKSLF